MVFCRDKKALLQDRQTRRQETKLQCLSHWLLIVIFIMEAEINRGRVSEMIGGKQFGGFKSSVFRCNCLLMGYMWKFGGVPYVCSGFSAWCLKFTVSHDSPWSLLHLHNAQSKGLSVSFFLICGFLVLCKTSVVFSWCTILFLPYEPCKLQGTVSTIVIRLLLLHPQTIVFLLGKERISSLLIWCQIVLLLMKVAINVGSSYGPRAAAGPEALPAPAAFPPPFLLSSF